MSKRYHFGGTLIHVHVTGCNQCILQVAFGGDFLEDPHVKSITAQGGSLFNLLDDVLLGFEKKLRNPMSEVWL